MRKIRKRRMAAVMVLCVGLLSGCAGKTQTDDLVITIPEYEKITYTTEPVVHGDIAPVLDLRLKSEQFERKEYYPDHDEMEVDQVFVHVGDVVQNGDTLVTFSSEDITEERRQYENRVEEDALLIDHYTKLDAINQTDEHQESIEQLKKDQEIAGLYIKDLDARLEAYTIKAEGSGIVSSLSDMLDYGTVYAGDAVVTILYGSDNYTTTTEDDYAFEVGQTFTATFGVGSYEVRLTAIDVLASDTDAGMKRQLTFTLVDSAKRPSSDSLNLEIEKNVLKNVLYVPEDAIVYVGNDNYVYVLDEDGFRHGVQVQTGATIDGYTVIEDRTETKTTAGIFDECTLRGLSGCLWNEICRCASFAGTGIWNGIVPGSICGRCRRSENRIWIDRANRTCGVLDDTGQRGRSPCRRWRLCGSWTGGSYCGSGSGTKGKTGSGRSPESARAKT